MTKGTSHASKPRKVATKSPAKAGTKARPGASKDKPMEPASRLIDQRILDLGGWRGETLARMRALILEADPEMTEEWKWMGTPVWSHHGIVCTGESYKAVVKLTFAKGARVPDPSGLFNSSLEGNTRRAIDIREGEKVDARAFKALVKAAVAQNAPAAKARPVANKARPVKLLSGGNPQIAKGDGDAPVQAYIAALPGWKRDVGSWLDALIVRSVPGVQKAVKWNSPLYGVEGQGWFLGIHAFTHYLKVSFFRGTSLRPLPPGPSKSEGTRYLDIREGDPLDAAQMAKWVKQAAALPGWVP
ncbi:YdhG-like domain-containing protein [Corallococcus soli]